MLGRYYAAKIDDDLRATWSRTCVTSDLERRDVMTARRVAGLVLVIVGMVVLAFGGVFWTDRDTVADFGGIEIATEEREGIRFPPVLGGASIIAGLVLLFVPSRRTA
jgi:uncharacterized membrane protein HdeD (DUF308 family)